MYPAGVVLHRDSRSVDERRVPFNPGRETKLENFQRPTLNVQRPGTVLELEVERWRFARVPSRAACNIMDYKRLGPDRRFVTALDYKAARAV